MFFDYLNPFHWIRTILGLFFIFLLILIPGWRTVFAQKTFSEAWKMLTSDFWGILSKVISEAFSYYKTWFQSKETQEKIKETKGAIIKIIERSLRGEPEGSGGKQVQ